LPKFGNSATFGFLPRTLGEYASLARGEYEVKRTAAWAIRSWGISAKAKSKLQNYLQNGIIFIVFALKKVKMLKQVKQGKIIVISGPSGSGKTTIVNKLCQSVPNLERSISVTTRQPRKNEKESVDYYFISEEEFKKKLEDDEFAEWAQYNSNYYGTLKKTIHDTIENNKDIILSIDVQGAEKLQNQYSEAIFIFIIPPSKSILKYRLKNRGTESKEEIQRRLSIAKREISYAKNYNYIVINYENKIEQVVKQVKYIILAERYRINNDILEEIDKEFC